MAEDRFAWDASRVHTLRRRLGLSQSAFARELGVRQQTVSEWETGRYAPRGASARLLALFEERLPYDAEPPAEGDAGVHVLSPRTRGVAESTHDATSGPPRLRGERARAP